MKNKFKLILLVFSFLTIILLSFYLPNIVSLPLLKEAMYYEKQSNKSVLCHLCPRNCLITNGRRGFCGVRENRAGSLYTLSYAKPVSIHIDPIEKKPLFHFLPNSTAFSIATAGCNLRCKFCQNWEISQKLPEDVEFTFIEPQELIMKVLESGSPVIAYTYTEPTIFYEYMLEIAKLARSKGIKNVMHSSGFINEAPLRELAEYLDAANIDLKAFSEDYYKKMCEGTLSAVLNSLKILKARGVHIEITNLVLPGYNDNEEMIKNMCLWIKNNLGSDTPLHFSRFYPMYKLLALNPTPIESLNKAREIALNCGLKYVYIGNVIGHDAENTFCPKCKSLLIERRGYFVSRNEIISGKCKFCGEKIYGLWN